MHNTMQISETEDRVVRARLVLLPAKPKDPDFDKLCESYRVIRLEVIHQQQLLRKYKEQGLK